MRFISENNALVALNNGETLRIEAWGPDSLRVRSTMFPEFKNLDWALSEKPKASSPKVNITEEDHWVGDGNIDKRPIASIENGRIKAVVNFAGIISFYRDGELVLREYYRQYDGTISRSSRCLKIVNRTWKGLYGGRNYELNVKFEPNKGEKIYGMGQ